MHHQGTLTERESSVQMTSLHYQGKLSTNDLLALTSLNQLLFKMKLLYISVKKQATLARRPTVLSLPLQLVFPAWYLHVEQRHPNPGSCSKLGAVVLVLKRGAGYLQL
jgi:hypothetical protein